MRHLRQTVVAVAAIALTLSGCKLLTATGSKGIFVVDSGNNRIVNVADIGCGGWTAYAGTATYTSPYSITLDSSARIYTSDRGAHDRIVRVDDMAGAGLATFGSSGTGTSQFNDPAGIRVDTASQTFVADSGNNRVVSFTGFPGTNWTAYAPTGGDALNAPMDVSWDTNSATSDGRVYILDTGNNQIVRVDSLATGANRAVFGAFGAGVGQFNAPRGLYLQSGKIYVADTGNSRIVSFNMSEFSNPTPPSWQTYSGTLTNPEGIFVNGTATRIYIADTGNHRIAQLDLPLPGANFLTCGSLGSGTGQFNTPTDVAVR